MKVANAEGLQVWQRARRFVEAVSAITRGAGFERDVRLRGQLDASADSILSNIAEGFGQATDRGFVRYLFIAKGSASEARSHLAVALIRGHVSAEQCAALANDTAEIDRMLSALIRYLRRSDRRDRA